MKKPILTIFILSINLCLAQSGNHYPIKVYDEFKTDDREVPDQHVGSNDKGHYFIYSKGKYGQGSSTLMRFSNDLKPTGEEILLTKNDKERNIKEYSLGAIEIDNKLLCITVKSTKTYKKFFKKSIDLNEFKITAEKEILSLSVDGTNMRWLYTSFLFPRNKNILGLFYENPTKLKNKSKYSLTLFDKDFNKLTHNDYEFSSHGKHFKIAGGVLLDNQEMILLTADLNNIATFELSKKTPVYDYNLVSLKNGEKKFIAKIPTDGKWVNNFELDVDKDTIRLIGLYGESGKFSANGTFFHKINRKNPKEVIHKVIPFDKDLLDSHIKISNFKSGLKRRVTKFGELPYYVVDGTHDFSDGSTLLVSEQMYTFTSNFITTYHYQNLLLTLFDKNGERKFSKMIKKDNSFTNTWVYSSYLITKHKEGYALMYNDSNKNLNPNDLRRYGAFASEENESFIITFVDTNGNITSNPITNKTKLQGYRIRPGLSSKLDNGTVLLFAQKPSNVKYQRFMSLSLENENL